MKIAARQLIYVILLTVFTIFAMSLVFILLFEAIVETESMTGSSTKPKKPKKTWPDFEAFLSVRRKEAKAYSVLGRIRTRWVWSFVIP